jgi:hypothetical protein
LSQQLALGIGGLAAKGADIGVGAWQAGADRAATAREAAKKQQRQIILDRLRLPQAKELEEHKAEMRQKYPAPSINVYNRAQQEAEAEKKIEAGNALDAAGAAGEADPERLAQTKDSVQMKNIIDLIHSIRMDEDISQRLNLPTETLSTEKGDRQYTPLGYKEMRGLFGDPAGVNALFEQVSTTIPEEWQHEVAKELMERARRAGRGNILDIGPGAADIWEHPSIQPYSAPRVSGFGPGISDWNMLQHSKERRENARREEARRKLAETLAQMLMLQRHEATSPEYRGRFPD